MRAATLAEGPPRQHALVVDSGDELVQGLTDSATEHQVGAATSFTGAAAFRE